MAADIWINAFTVATYSKMSDAKKIEIADSVINALLSKINDPDCERDELGLKKWEITVRTS